MFYKRFPSVSRLVKANFLVAFIALTIGGLFGLIQALHRTNYFRGIINSSDYYTVVTGHGVLLALVFTFFFTTGLFSWATSRSLDRSLPSSLFSWSWFAMMTIGTGMAGTAIIGGLVEGIPMQASVLYTFYAPLKAHPVFYIGAALLIVGTWLAGADWIWAMSRWRADHPDDRIPLQMHMVLFTMLMWYISSIGVAVEVVVFLIPWSLGWIDTVDPLLTRTLFWYFGHPVVYFWLLPAYLVWYTILPKIAGGRLFSDPLARVVFVLFLVLSTPVGFHHQFTDPGIATGYKFVAMTNTMFLLLPSLLTAFTVLASLEYGAKQNGGTGWISWLKDLPWEDPSFAGIFLAALMFAAGGFSGMINAGMNINYLVHNTLWVPGHFHLTVGTAVALTFMAITYWLLPQLTGKPLRFYWLAILQPYLWFGGMTLMSNAMHRAGLAGVPRRTADPTYRNVTYDQVAGGMGEMQFQIAIGGTILFVSLIFFLLVVGGSWLLPAWDEDIHVDPVLPDPLSGVEHGPAILDNWKLWLGIAIVLILAVYGLPIADLLSDGVLTPGAEPFVP
jgi:cytochrome c oxidase subunit 1